MYRTAICDLDGVIWLSSQVIAGAPEAVHRLRDRNWRVVFVTNNAFVSVTSIEAKLLAMGIPAVGDVITSAQAAAGLIRSGERVYMVAGPGAAEEVQRAGGRLVTDGPVDVVVVGLNPNFDYEVLKKATQAIRRGARFIATNDDATYPTPDGPIPGGGAIVAAIETAAGQRATVAGKPYAPMADLVRRHLGVPTVMIGDRPDTDGLFAAALGVPFALVLSGVTTRADLPVTPNPAYVADNLSELIEQLD